jgi:small subunit ribosomal protein S6
MAKEAPLYDLILMLTADAEESTRTKILSDVEAAITTAGGSVERNDEWGRRPLAFEIRHLSEAEYHLLQFKAPATLIEELSHTLRITDGVLRFRVIKVRPGTPEAPSSVPVVAAVASGPTAGASASPEAAASASPEAEASASPEPAVAAAPAES